MKFLGKMVDVRRDEVKALAWGWLYVFALFLAYYVLRPIREELGVAGGVDNLPWLFTGTLIAMLLLSPAYGYIVKNRSREKSIAVSYRLFMAVLLVFLVLLLVTTPAQQVWIGRAFFIFVSVFNLFVVSVFWSLIVDVFNNEQGKRLFGFLAAGATIGGIAGSAITSVLVRFVDQSWLLVISILLLEVAVLASKKLSGTNTGFSEGNVKVEEKEAIGGGILSGLTHTFRSPYLLMIAAFMLINSVTQTFLYFQQAGLAEANFQERAARTIFFANIDLLVNVFTLIFQFFIVGRLIKVSGVTFVLCALPIVCILGFTILAIYPTIATLVAVQVLRRVGNFGLSRPARELLFVSIPREDRYKAKNFIDTFVYRGGDQIGSWAYAGLSAIGIGMAGIAIVAVPLSVVWLGVSVWLGRRQQKTGIISEESKMIDNGYLPKIISGQGKIAVM